MKILFCIHTPAHVHLFRNAVSILASKGNYIKVIARDYGITLKLLDEYKLKYQVYLKDSKRYKFLKGFQILVYIFNEYRFSRVFDPDLIIGIGTDDPLFAKLLRKPCIIFNDSENTPVQHLINKTFADVIITPSCFRKNLGNKQIRVEGYKELAYLHPNYFKPDSSVFTDLHLAQYQKYIILRFNAFDAFHDIGKHGFGALDQLKLVQQLSKYARVFISPEGPLQQCLEEYRLPVAHSNIHHVLYYADLLVTDTQTMATEAAILGTPVVRCNNFVGPNDLGNFIELEQKYGLIYSFQKPEQAIQKAIELIKQTDVKEQWAKKRQKLLVDKIDITQYLVDFIENYPLKLKHY